MDEEKVIDPRYIERLRSLPKSNYDDKQDAMAQAMAGHAVFHPDSPFVSIEARSHVNTIPEIPHVDIPQKEQYAFDKEKSAEEELGEAIESEIIAFGGKHGFPVIYVITEQDVLPMTVIGGNVVRGGKLNLFMASEMRKAERIAKKYNGTIGICKNPAEKYIDELNPQPVLDGPMPKFCIAHHCTERGPKCDKCAYTAMATHENAKENESFYETPKVTRAILLLIEEEMKRQGVGRIEDLKCPDRSTEERLQLEQRLKQAFEKEPVKMVVPSSICAPGYESGLAARSSSNNSRDWFINDKRSKDEIIDDLIKKIRRLEDERDYWKRKAKGDDDDTLGIFKHWDD